MSLLTIFKALERLRNKLFTLTCRGSFYGLGARSVLALPIRLGGEEQIEIGSNVFVGDHSWIQVLENETGGITPTISIGDGTSISGFCTIIAVKEIVIESEVLIGRYVHISDHSHRYSDVALPIKLQGITDPATVRIGRGTWIGQGVVICPGVTIGRNAVIGANSVVRSNVDDYCVAAGAPARIIRRITSSNSVSESVSAPALS